jgi:hypothetical protein
MLHYRGFHAPRPQKLRVATKYRVFRDTDIKRLQGIQGNGRFSSFAGRERQSLAMVYQEGRRDRVSVQVAGLCGRLQNSGNDDEDKQDQHLTHQPPLRALIHRLCPTASTVLLFRQNFTFRTCFAFSPWSRSRRPFLPRREQNRRCPRRIPMHGGLPRSSASRVPARR